MCLFKAIRSLKILPHLLHRKVGCTSLLCRWTAANVANSFPKGRKQQTPIEEDPSFLRHVYGVAARLVGENFFWLRRMFNVLGLKWQNCVR